ncbi:translation machinery-associated protein 20 [Vairimorpha necatrix]|uniref:Translation machinery-associated protein 20 n=1 Tax=Vairimorpha necatrix TaxID=6039 RepID=A0AAX4JA10_9MICR
MKSLFCKIEIISTSQISKKDKKSINKICNTELLKKQEEYQIAKLKNRSNLILDGNKAIMFFFNNKYIPTIKTLEQNLLNLPTVYLDSGAIGPLERGANVMAPGVFKYIDQCIEDFKKNDIVCIKIINMGILAVGQALLDKREFKQNTTGEAIEILHIKNDELYNKY